MVILSYFMTSQSKVNYENSARKAFQNKYDVVQTVFKNLEDFQLSLTDMVAKSNSFELKKNLQLLNQFKIQQNIKPYTWYDDLNGNIPLDDALLQVTLPKGNQQLLQKIEKFKVKEVQNIVFSKDNTPYWTIFNENKSREIIYGFTIKLTQLHDYFSQVTQNQDNYAFVFTKNGTCITHPDEKFIGKNIFRFTNVQVKDTLTNVEQKGYTENIAQSEYLNLEVTRFIKPLKTNNFDGYVAVNYVRFLIDEKVNETKYYVLFIFVATFILILIIFILFHQSSNNAFREKEKVQSEKNRLQIVNEAMQKENAMNQLQQLKNQINPHFLFNSLNSLYMLIGIDATNAQKFTMDLSKIYRYLIVPPKENWVFIKEELAFIQHYMDLQKSRFEEEIHFNLIINTNEINDKKIPYLSLQIAIENAIKHNVATIDLPLFIEIIDSTSGLIISNTYQPKTKNTDGTGFGLEYLQKIYDFYGNNELSTRVENGKFILFLPYLK
ncbi:MAG: histidine kinase [Bacteroidetes bacterium]|nr:histidine kinase [Bacteroidota bacterium]